MLIAGNRELNNLAMKFVASRPGARSYSCAQAHAVDMVRSTAVDLVLLDVDASLMTGFVLAAHIRAADRGRNDGRRAAILAATSSQCKFKDCHPAAARSKEY